MIKWTKHYWYNVTQTKSSSLTLKDEGIMIYQSIILIYNINKIYLFIELFEWYE